VLVGGLEGGGLGRKGPAVAAAWFDGRPHDAESR
jgi:hypothetical protein